MSDARRSHKIDASAVSATASAPTARRAVVLICNLMVVDGLDTTHADRVFHALADATRRDILARTLDSPHNISALARCYPMSFAAVQKHVAVLQRARLVTKVRRGREQLVRGNVETTRQAAQFLDRLEAVWTQRVDTVGELLATDPNGGPPP